MAGIIVWVLLIIAIFACIFPWYITLALAAFWIAFSVVSVFFNNNVL